MSRRTLHDPICHAIRDNMFLLTTNELPDEDAKAAYLHLSECSKCRRALAEHVKLVGALFGTMGASHRTA